MTVQQTHDFRSTCWNEKSYGDCGFMGYSNDALAVTVKLHVYRAVIPRQTHGGRAATLRWAKYFSDGYIYWPSPSIVH